MASSKIQKSETEEKKIILTNDEMHKIEMNHKDMEILNAKNDLCKEAISRITIQIKMLQVEQNNIAQERNNMINRLRTKTDEHNEYIDKLIGKYGLERGKGLNYDNETGEIILKE